MSVFLSPPFFPSLGHGCYCFTGLFNKFPVELYGEEGPTGPKEKNNWIQEDKRCKFLGWDDDLAKYLNQGFGSTVEVSLYLSQLEGSKQKIIATEQKLA